MALLKVEVVPAVLDVVALVDAVDAVVLVVLVVANSVPNDLLGRLLSKHALSFNQSSDL